MEEHDASALAEEQPTPEIPGGHEVDPEEAPTAPLAAEQRAPVIDRLRRAYAGRAAAERHLTIAIVPGVYGGDLAFRARPIEWEKFRKEAEKAQRRGGLSEAEAEATFAAKVIANACETILLTDEGDLKPAEEVVSEFAHTGPVRFDDRLAQIVGLDLGDRNPPAHEIVRLVFGNKAALQGVLRELLAFFQEDTPGDDEEDGADRPT